MIPGIPDVISHVFLNLYSCTGSYGHEAIMAGRTFHIVEKKVIGKLFKLIGR